MENEGGAGQGQGQKPHPCGIAHDCKVVEMASQPEKMKPCPFCGYPPDGQIGHADDCWMMIHRDLTVPLEKVKVAWNRRDYLEPGKVQNEPK